MTRDPSQKKTPRDATPGARNAEERTPMDAPFGSPTPSRDGLPPEEALLYWQELSPRALEALDAHPAHGPKLRLLQAAEGWLETRGTDSTCPTTEELYDFGRGPGYRPLERDAAERIEAHVARCGECRRMVATLRQAPPVPLELGIDDASPLQPTELRSVRRPSQLRLAAPLATAAAVLALVGLFQFANSDNDVLAEMSGEYPSALVLRGASEPLAYPRGLVLERPDDAPNWSRELAFEMRLEDVTGITLYRVEVRRHDGAAFSTGETIGRFESTEPVVTADADWTLALEPGHYTWDAWVTRAGLEERLGERDFEVVSAPRAWEILRAATPFDLRAVQYLHDSGYVTDAREFAQSFPRDAARDAYLEMTPR